MHKIGASIVFLILLNINSLSASEKVARIIGGERADSNDWPWVAGLVINHSSSTEVFCGASLIDKDWVLTAAHCVINIKSSSFDVIVNKPRLNQEGGERLSVDYVVLHPEYNDLTLDNDLALIKLSSPSNIPPINILAPFTSQDSAGKSAIALGWGATSTEPITYPLDLQQVDLPLISNPRCSASMGIITDDMLCAGNGQGDKDTCFGDSGGPLIIFDTESNSWRQAGITSWGFDCAEKNSFGVYTRLKNYAGFISEHICTAHETPTMTLLDLNVDGNLVTASWNPVNNITGYRLNYAPYPEAQTISSIDMNSATSFSIELGTGFAFYVAITSYNMNCLSDYSNIEYFIIK